MQDVQATATEGSQLQAMMNYALELELEVDRLRRRDQVLQQEARDHIRQTVALCRQSGGVLSEGNAKPGITEACESFEKFLRDFHEPPGCNASFDQVVGIAVRPLVEQVFRWQQRLSGVAHAVLHLDLQPESINWFPARLRHILDNLISNALRYCDHTKGEIRVGLQLRLVDNCYEMRFVDNGLGIADDQAAGMLHLLYRATLTRGAGLGVGLAVVKLLVDHSCGSLSVISGKGQGTSVTVVLPRYDLADHID